MKKIIIGSLIALSSLSAEIYIGLGLGTGTSSFTTSVTTGSIESDVVLVDGRVGWLFDSDNRIEVSGRSLTVTTSGSADRTYSGSDFNWIWTVTNPSFVTPFLSLGFGSYTATINSTSYDAVSVNGGLGVIFAVGDVWEVDLTVNSHFIGYDVGTTSVNENTTVTNVGVKYIF